ncbi:MAG: type I-E CRISPR-associated protein Cse2/CasB [Proteobacteria bacterium]|nr:type I-E CRISPR-associated protein Cse2/CasB [Pseudomonadota bacterium]MBU1698081.1 type I-E CRISPR-associated protein Cse2/CasB [Pseudomonadota bacterium]
MSQTFARGFVNYLQSMDGERGKLATLRKGLIDNQAQATWPLLNRFLDFDNSYQIKVLQTIGGLFAHHPVNTNSGNFGSLCCQLLSPEEKQKITDGESGPISRHFQYALAANGAEIFPRVRRLVLRAKKDEIPVNYIQLADDLLGWQSYKKDRIKLSWGREFWKVNLVPEDEKSESEAETHD